MMNLRIVISLFMLFGGVVSYPMYQQKIPNGQNVPSPCNPNSTWAGVGHTNPAGGGPRNPFGIDFGLHNHNWAAVCPLDSDGDGKTNGAELGDPNCTWKEGDPSPTGSLLSHPGICEPLSAAMCMQKNMWLQCLPPFNCPAINDPGVTKLNLRVPPTPVPTVETTYICSAFNLTKMLPDNMIDYHVIAETPIINTSAVMHHILVYACSSVPTNMDLFTKAIPCGMEDLGVCHAFVGAWGFGFGGVCFTKQFGFRMGLNGFKYVLMQLHWNNPMGLANLVDSSGMTFYYTKNLRQYDGASLLIGQMSFGIPPGKPLYTVRGTCLASCTSKVAKPLNVTIAAIHMHLAGISGTIKQYRNGVKLATLVDANPYEYNRPEPFMYDNPVVFMPGDELVTTCNYNTTGRTKTTYYGPSTSDEMCNGFLIYYPAEPNFDFCGQYGKLTDCTNALPQCDIYPLYAIATSMKTCNFADCSMSCRLLMQQFLQNNCLQGEVAGFVLSTNPDILRLFQLRDMCSLPPTPKPTRKPGHHSKRKSNKNKKNKNKKNKNKKNKNKKPTKSDGGVPRRNQNSMGKKKNSAGGRKKT